MLQAPCSKLTIIPDAIRRFDVTSRKRSDNEDTPTGRLKRIHIMGLARVKLCGNVRRFQKFLAEPLSVFVIPALRLGSG
jgi:hypothetical protein